MNLYTKQKKTHKQKKHMVMVKLNASAESDQAKTSLNGIFKIDQAYNTPENNIVNTPTAR